MKWGAPDLGAPAVIRYAFVDRAVTRPGATNCKAMVPFPARLSGIVPFADVTVEFRNAFAAWEGAANIAFEETDDMAEADVLLGVQARPRGIAFADVIPAAEYTSSVGLIRQGAVCFNPEAAWETGFDGDERTYDVRYVAMHEIGHVLGLDHAYGETETVMDFKYRENIRSPQAGDVASAAFLYGPRAITSASAEELPVKY